MAKSANTKVAPEKRRLITTTVAGSILTMTVGDVGSLEIDTAAVPESVRTLAMLHGFRQKISDAAAMAKDDPNNNPAGKFAAMIAVCDGLIAGDWSTRGTGDGSGPVAGIIFLAFERWATEMATAKGATVDVEKVRAAYDAKDRSQRLALRNVPRIAEIMEEIKASRGTVAAVDTDDLLDELGLLDD